MDMLIVQACGVAGEKEEIEMISAQANAYGLKTKIISPKTKEEFDAELYSGTGYDYIYVSSHGNEKMLCNQDNSIQISWLEFGLMLCESGALNENTIIMLSCCRGGLNQVAYALFHSCPDVRYVVGARSSLNSSQMHICYGLLLYLMVVDNLDPVVACDKILAATNIRFYFSDRLEIEVEYGYETSELKNSRELNTLKAERGWFDSAPVDVDEGKLPPSTNETVAA